MGNEERQAAAHPAVFFCCAEQDNGNAAGITNNRSGASGRSQLFAYASG
jgi:hypothetical protein